MRFAQVDLVAVFQRAQQLDAFDGAELQLLASASSAQHLFQFDLAVHSVGFEPVPRGDFAPAQFGLGGSLDLREQRLLSGRTREILAGPNEPVTHLLKPGEPRFALRTISAAPAAGLLDDREAAVPRRAPRCRRDEADDDAIAHPGFLAQLRFEVLGVDIQAFGRDDYIFSAALEYKFPEGSRSAMSPV